MTYEEAKALKKELDTKVDYFGGILQAFERNEFGLVPDHIRATPEWEEANRNYKKSFSELRNINTLMLKEFKKEYAADKRKNRRIYKGDDQEQ